MHHPPETKRLRCLVVTLYNQVTEQAGDLWSNFENSDAKLFAVLMEHEARQSALLYLRDAFNGYLASARVENAAIPADLPALQEQCGIRLVVADAQDPLGVGVKQWMTCFYVAGTADSLHNFLVLLDGFISYKAKASAKQFDIELHPHTGIDLDEVWNQLSYETVVGQSAGNTCHSEINIEHL